MRTGSYIDRTIRAMEYARRAIAECRGDCNEKANLQICDKTGEAYIVACPLLSRDCHRGRSYLERAKQFAAQSLPKGIPNRYRELVPAATDTLALDRVREWNRKGVMYIYGATGSGKSYAAAWCVYHLILNRLETDWNKPYKWNEIRDVNLAWFSAYQVTLERANLYAAQSAGLLVLDDLGAESETSLNKATILELIGQRYNSKLPTIITSNLDLEKMASRYTQRFYDRVVPDGQIVFTGDRNWRVN